MSFTSKIKVVKRGRTILAVMFRQIYYPRYGKHKAGIVPKRYRWVMADYEVEDR